MRHSIPARVRFALLAAVLAGAFACRAPAELDAVKDLPELADDRLTLTKVFVAVDESQDADVLPSDLMTAGSGSQGRRPIDQLRLTIEAAMIESGHFAIVPEERADYRVAFAVEEVTDESQSEQGMTDWFMWKFFNRYLVARVRLSGAVTDTVNGQQVGPDIEESGQYRIMTGKAFRSGTDEGLNLLGMRASFAKNRSPAVSNAMQKAIVKLISEVSRVTSVQAGPAKPRQKEVNE